MLIIQGIELEESWTIRFALKKIYGINFSTITQICIYFNIKPTLQINELTIKQTQLLKKYIEKTFLIEQKLKQQTYSNILRLINNRSYRGFRHLHNLPVRGQRTHSNAQTQRYRSFYQQLKNQNIL